MATIAGSSLARALTGSCGGSESMGRSTVTLCASEPEAGRGNAEPPSNGNSSGTAAGGLAAGALTDGD